MSDQAPDGYLWIVFPRIPGGKALLHQRDFDASRHTAYVDAPPAPPEQTEEEKRAAFIAEQLARPAVEVIEKVQVAPFDAIGTLKAMREVEAKDKKRKTVIEAIDAQIAKLTTPPPTTT